MFRKMKFLLKLSMLFLLFFTFNFSVKGEDFYTVDNISIDIVSDNIGLAREIGTNDAIYIGFKRLLSWKLNRQDFQIIERIINNENTNLKNIKDFTGGYKIHHEKFSNYNYRAKFSIFYDLNKIKNWLAINDISYSEKNITNILIVPVMNLNGKIFLWDESSFWSDLWQDKLTNKYIKNFVFPYGDIDDVIKLSFEDLYYLDLEKLYTFSERYKLNNIFVPFVYVSFKNEKNFEAEFGAHLIINNNLVNLIKVKRFNSIEGESLNDLILRCKKNISDLIINYFEKEQIVNNVIVRLNAKFNDFASWLIMKKNINNIKEIIEYNVVSIAINKAIIDIKISLNNESDLFNIFNNSRLGISKNIYNEYDISIISKDEIIRNDNKMDGKNYDDEKTILVIE
tara:strand:- start:25 stop:1215 length:1191 start_codon:yes stop_codon:yes gene_type:complete